jgi:hypothetical protein
MHEFSRGPLGGLSQMPFPGPFGERFYRILMVRKRHCDISEALTNVFALQPEPGGLHLGLGAPGSPGPSRPHSSSLRAGSLGEREPARIPILTSFHKLHFPFVKPSNAKLRNCGNVELIKVSCILYPC